MRAKRAIFSGYMVSRKGVLLMRAVSWSRTAASDVTDDGLEMLSLHVRISARPFCTARVRNKEENPPRTTMYEEFGMTARLQ